MSKVKETKVTRPQNKIKKYRLRHATQKSVRMQIGGKMVYLFLADGFEELEALTQVDLLRRAGIGIKTVSVTSSKTVTGAHKIATNADILFSESDYSDAELLFLPGGMPGTTNLSNHEGLCNLLLKKYESNPGTLLNDIIKINDYKICICSTSSNKELLYLLILSLFDNDKKVMVNYYAIEIYKLYSHKIYDMRLFLYNDYITFGFSHCNQDNCESNEIKSDLHFSSFIIFNYPNGTDNNLDLLDYLLNAKIDTNNLAINLSNNIIIENNIFGYKIIGIKILDIIGDLDIKYSKNKTIISKNFIVLKDDDI